MKGKIWIALIAVYIVWGSTYLAIRFAVETIPPFLMAGTRFLISGLILYIWRRSAGDPNPTPRQWRSAVIVGLLLLLGGNGVLGWAEQHVPSAIAALVLASIPLWIVLIDTFRPDSLKPDWKIILGLLMGFGGLILLVISSMSVSTSAKINPVEVGALILAAISWSLGSVFSRDANISDSPMMSTGVQMLGGGVGLYLLATFTGEWQTLNFAAISTRSLLGLVFLITFGSLVGFVSYTWLLQNAPISLVSTYAYVNPVVAIFLGAWLGNELINGRIIIASLIIIGAVVVVNMSKQTKIVLKEKLPASAAD